jgi:FAD/FMN-containing dehydrogenase
MAGVQHSVLKGVIPRRQFLSLCLLGAAPAFLAACQSAPPKAGPVLSPTPPPTATTRPLPPSEADWSSLGTSLEGSLIRPGMPAYLTARQLFNPRFDGVQPMAIAYCTSSLDVQQCLAFTRRFDLPLACRAGGHSYGGYSTTGGLVVDVTRMKVISVDVAAGTAAVGAGSRLIDVYAALAAHGLIVPAGSCPTVGIAGLTQGGGLGVLGRKFGLTCDNLLSAEVVLADGRLITCDATEESDLFWALRGGGGGNFGVVTSLTFRTHPIGTVALCTLDWPWERAVDVVQAWQNWAPQAPDELWSNCLLLASADKHALPGARVNGVYVGAASALQPLVSALIDQIGLSPSSTYISDVTLLEAMLIEANCGGLTVAECHLPSQDPQGQLQRDTFGAKSDYFDHILPRQGITNLVNSLASRQASKELGAGVIVLDASGGAINHVDPAATAFVHRSSLFSAQYFANWNATDSLAVVLANQQWLADTWQLMRPYASGAAYQNYLDPDLVDWQNAYYGANLPRLEQVKAAYDPLDLFHFDQSIPPARPVTA